MSGNEVRGVAGVYDDGNPKFEIMITDEYIWVNNGVLLIQPDDWEDFKNGVERARAAFKRLTESSV